MEQRIYELAEEEFTIGSPQQLGEILFVKLGLSRKRRGKTGFSTDARVLQAIREEHEIVPHIERWRELSTLIKTYLDVLPEQVDEGSRIHTTFLQAGAQTGRLASTNPNMQNVPIRTPLGREIRGCFEAEQGSLLISADYSQIELRVLAHMAEEPVLVEIFKRGEDVHTATASQVFEVAPDADRSGHALEGEDDQLRDRLRTLRLRTCRPSEHPAWRRPKSSSTPTWSASRAVAEFIAETIERAKEEGHVKTLWGAAPADPRAAGPQLSGANVGERLAVNTVIQGTAADIIKLAMVRCHDALREGGFSTRLILTIHDELLFEAPPDEREAACC